MHLLIVTPLYPPATGGAATYFSMLVPELLQRAEIDRVTVVTERVAGEPKEQRDGKLQVLRLLPTRVAVPRASWLGHASSYVATQWWFGARFPHLVHRLGVDVIHFHTRYRGSAVYGALRRSRVPVIANLQDKLMDPRRVARVSHWLLCCAEGVHRFLLAAGCPAERSVLVPLPFASPPVPSDHEVQLARHRYDLERTPYFLFLGDITKRKGVYELLDGYRQWRCEVEDPPALVFAGNNWEGERFRAAIRQTPGGLYLGRVPHDEALALMRGAEVIVLPSRSEALPYVILEALALGKSILCPPGIPEFDAHLSTSVLPEITSAAIAAALRTARARVEAPSYPMARHAPHHIAAKLLELYTRAVDGGVDDRWQA